MSSCRWSFHPCLAVLALLLLMGCGAHTSPSRVTVPGAEPTTKSTALEAGAAMLQAMPPKCTYERYALKALRGDFQQLPAEGSGMNHASAMRVLEAVKR